MSGCPSAVVVSSIRGGIDAAQLYIKATEPDPVIAFPECTDEVEPIYLDEGFRERLTEDERQQIFEQAVKLEKLCGANAEADDQG